MREAIGIVGAGLTGLSAAYYLEQLGHSPIIFEKELKPGGRVSTEEHEGFLLDRGFQVLLTSYPEVKRLLRFYELDPKYFPSGVRVYFEKEWHTFYNPLKHPLAVWRQRHLPFASFSDVVKLSSLYFKRAKSSEAPHFDPSASSIVPFLQEQKLTSPFIEAFIRPLFGGIFLDPSLHVSHEIFLWILRFFIEGRVALPQRGMRALPEAIVRKLSRTQFRYGTSVAAVHGQTIYLEGGEEVNCSKVIIAVGADKARELIKSLPEMKMRSCKTLYFALDQAACSEDLPLLYLNGGGAGPVNHAAFLNLMQPSYAPPGKLLLSATVIDEKWLLAKDLDSLVQGQLAEWFNVAEKELHHLKSYAIINALPDQSMPPPLQERYQVDRHPDIFVAGELTDHASINGALLSGRRVALVVHEACKNQGLLIRNS